MGRGRPTDVARILPLENGPLTTCFFEVSSTPVCWTPGGRQRCALLLATIGIYGVLSYSVSQRTREIGIRMALGATRGSVLGFVFRQGALIGAAGVVAGVVGSLASMRLIGDLLFGVTPTDLTTYLEIPLLLFAVILCATWIPARRATSVDPISALRWE